MIVVKIADGSITQGLQNVLSKVFFALFSSLMRRMNVPGLDLLRIEEVARKLHQF